MASRKDLLKAHNFTTQRMVSALVDRDPDAPVSPLRRITTATFVSLLIGIVALAGSFLIGKLRPGLATDWKQDGVVVVDMDTTTIYVFNGVSLVPMTDMTSARLYASGRASGGIPQVRQVRSKLLTDTPIAARHGIPNAPYNLPAPDRVGSFPLRACAAEPIGNRRPITVQFGGSFQPSNQDVSIIAENSADELYLIFRGIAHKLYTENGSSTLQEQIPTVTLPDPWIAALPLGNPIDKMVLPGLGTPPQRPTTKNNSYVVGDVVATDTNPNVDGDERYYVQTNQGLQRISWVDKMLLEPGPITAVPSDRISGDLAPENLPLEQKVGTAGLPFDMPTAPTQNISALSICLTYTGPVNYQGDSSAAPKLSIGTAPTVSGGTTINGIKADVVQTRSPGGALLQKDSLTGVARPSTLVVNGKRYDIPTQKDRVALGYPDTSPPSLVPAGLINLIPDGMASGVTLTPTSVVTIP